VVSSKELFRLPKAYPPANKLTTLSISLGCTEPLLVGGFPDGDFKVKCMSGLGVLQNTNLSNKSYQIVLFYHAYDTTASKQLSVNVEFFCSYTLEKNVMRCTNSYSGSQPIILNLNTFPTLNLFQGKLTQIIQISTIDTIIHDREEHTCVYCKISSSLSWVPHSWSRTSSANTERLDKLPVFCKL
jgi:hypothetical protein